MFYKVAEKIENLLFLKIIQFFVLSKIIQISRKKTGFRRQDKGNVWFIICDQVTTLCLQLDSSYKTPSLFQTRNCVQNRDQDHGHDQKYCRTRIGTSFCLRPGFGPRPAPYGIWDGVQSQDHIEIITKFNKLTASMLLQWLFSSFPTG